MVNSSKIYGDIYQQAAFDLNQLDSIICSFSPAIRKPVSAQTKLIAKKFLREFVRSDLCTELPQMNAEPLKGPVPLTMKGPFYSSAPIQSLGGRACCKTISTYPPKVGSHTRMGDPVCDRYTLKIYENRIVSALADGCSWGARSRSAAKRACKSFTHYIEAHQKKGNNLQEIAKIMLEGFACGHKDILETCEDAIWEAGTTTLNGSILLKATPGDESMYKWVFLSCNLGDCKSFYYSTQTKKARDITRNTRLDVQNSADPGGKLGPRDGEPKPDLRNLNIFWQYCEEGDYIIVVTDGVYDNFDLRHQGYIPSDVGLEGSDWFTCAKDAAEVLNRRHVEEQITKILSNIENKDLNADSICIALTQYCYNLTENTRQFMMENPTLRLPKDYGKYPGKVDHCTVVCYQVGNGGVSIDQWFGK